MQPILTLTLNPALDIATGVGRVAPGPKLRCGPARFDAGGGGLNVSRALQRMGAPSQALVALGGPTGERLAGLLRAEGIRFHSLQSPGETRQSLNVTEGETGAQYRFLLPGPVWSAADLAQIFAGVTSAAEPGGLVVVSGSLPPGLPDDFPAQLATTLPEAPVILDTSGPALAHAVASPAPGLAVLRMDRDEAETMARRRLPEAKDTADFASELVARGAAQCVIIARGAEGNVLATGALRLIAKPPVVPVVSAIGAGDSFVAGLALAMARHQGWKEALALGTAAAAAAVMTPATELCRGADVTALLPQIQLSEI